MNIHHHARHIRKTRTRSRSPRGVAMLLVLISLATATILTMAYVSSRDNSIEIGANVADAATARWSAMSGIEIGAAILETESDWRTNHVNGVLLDDYVLGSATIDLIVEDMGTNAPPTETTNMVKLTSIATVDGVSQSASATAMVDNSGAGGGISVDLGEFAIFTTLGASVNDNATIARWPKAPNSAMGYRVAMGTTNIFPGAIAFNQNAAAIDTTVYHNQMASAGLVQNSNSPPILMAPMQSFIPFPKPPAIPVPTPQEMADAGQTFIDLDTTGGITINTDTRYASIRMRTQNGIMQVQGDITLVAEADFLLNPNAGMTIDGNVTLVAFDTIELKPGSYIELLPGATLTIYAIGDVEVEDAYIGEQRADQSIRDASGAAAYMAPNRLNIFGTSMFKTWDISSNSVIKASIYAPYMPMSIQDDSAVYGRVAVARLTMNANAGLFYDHSLNSGGGYTNPNSPLFEVDGTINTNVSSLFSLSASDLQTLADTTGFPINTMFGMTTPTSGGGGGGAILGPTDPTPRPVIVVLNFKSYGIDTSNWEDYAAGAVVVIIDDPAGSSGYTNTTVQSPGDFSMVQ